MNTDTIALLTEELKVVSNADEFWETCLKALVNLGITGVGYGVVPIRGLAQRGQITEATFFRHSYALEWERAIGKANLLDVDNTTEVMLDSAQESFWHKAPEAFGDSYVKDNIHELEQDLGMIWGKSLILSHHSTDPLTSGIGLHVSCVNSEREFCKYWAEYSSTLRAISELLNTGMLGQHKDGVVRLTGREKDYLYWAAMGLDRIETAHRLGISENTLDKPIASAKAKLKARNTSQAVAKAVLLGLIDL